MRIGDRRGGAACMRSGWCLVGSNEVSIAEVWMRKWERKVSCDTVPQVFLPHSYLLFLCDMSMFDCTKRKHPPIKRAIRTLYTLCPAYIHIYTKQTRTIIPPIRDHTPIKPSLPILKTSATYHPSESQSLQAILKNRRTFFTLDRLLSKRGRHAD